MSSSGTRRHYLGDCNEKNVDRTEERETLRHPTLSLTNQTSDPLLLKDAYVRDDTPTANVNPPQDIQTCNP